MNPELRQTLQHISRNIESANEAAQENIYTFTQIYIDPCIDGIRNCFYECTASCFPNREDQLRRKRGRSRGRAEFAFDFYDDWDEDVLGASEGTGWGNDELDSLLAGRGPSQPRRQRAMSYGTRRRREEEADPSGIPKSSYLGFLDILPFRIGQSRKKYHPSAANLEENPGGLRIRDVESAEPLPTEGAAGAYQRGHSRQRSDTEVSRSTMTSHSSRGDLIMSDEEDAVPLDDGFAAAILSRRTTGTSGADERVFGKGRRPAGSRISSRAVSTRSVHSQGSPRLSSKSLFKFSEVTPESNHQSIRNQDQPSLADMKHDEEQPQNREGLEAFKGRETVQNFPQSVGTNLEMKPSSIGAESGHDKESLSVSPLKDDAPVGYFTLSSPVSPGGETEPFPNIASPTSPRSPFGKRELEADRPP